MPLQMILVHLLIFDPGGKSDLKIKDKNNIYINSHKIGKAIIFNSELQHSAENYSDSNRIILYVDFEIK